jgi:hypothetical protein
MANGQIVEFIDCTSLSISYDVMGIATVNFTVVRNDANWPSSSVLNDIEAGGRTFSGYVTNASISQIPFTNEWFETRVTLISIAK